MTGNAGGPISAALEMGDASRVGEARRLAERLAADAGFDEATRGRVSLVVTEVATNLVRHTREGTLVLSALDKAGQKSLEILAIDRGPGFLDLARSMQDGHSTAGTAGHGLGAIRRASDLVDAYTSTDEPLGTVMVVVIFGAQTASLPEWGTMSLGVVCRPVSGEIDCGDAWVVGRRGTRTAVLVVDGLGHGPAAAEAAEMARSLFNDRPTFGPGDFVAAAHDALRPTRGAALAIAELDPGRRTIRFAGVGNISAAILSYDRSQSLASMNGTVGHAMQHVRELTYEWPPGSTVVMHTDGLGTRWRIDTYRGILGRHPAVLAGVLYRDWYRGRDDATVLAIREPAPSRQE
jgi:anti-sigma regulatory factor (Ser/Thr protein kinase)